jgi:hypothetical protein
MLILYFGRHCIYYIYYKAGYLHFFCVCETQIDGLSRLLTKMLFFFSRTVVVPVTEFNFSV